MGTPVNIGSTSYNVAAQGQRGWGPDTTALLLRLATVANQVVTSNYVLTSDTFFSDVSGTYGIKSNFLKGVGAIASSDGFLRMASPHANPGQGGSYPGGTPEGKSYTYISWRNSTNSGDLHLFPNSDNQTVQFNGRDFINTTSVQTISNKNIGVSNVVDGGAITADSITNSQIFSAAAIAYSKLAALTASRLLVSDGSGVVSASSVTSAQAGYLSNVTSDIQAQIAAKIGLADAVTLTNKTIVVANNTITTAASGNLAAIELNAALAELQTDIDTRVPTSTGVTLTGTQTVSNKTLTAVAGVTLTSGAAIDWAAGAASIGASIGINNLTVGGAGTTVLAPGILRGAIVVTNSNSFFMNAGAAGSGADWTATIVRPTSGMLANATYTLPTTTTVLVGRDTTDTLTNKTLTSPVLTTPNLGTPSSLVLTNATGLPVAGGGTGQVTANAAFNALAPSQTSQTGKFLQTDGSNTSWVASSGGLSAVTTTANVTTAVANTMYSCTSTGGFTITLPTIPALGAVIGVMDAGETCSATNFIRVTPATGQSIDGYVANDSILLDYTRANVTLYAAPGATSWKVQYQATTVASPSIVNGSLRVHTSNGYGSTNTRTRRFTTTALTQGSGFTFNQSATLGDDITVTENGIYSIHYCDQFTGAGNFGLSKNSSQMTTDIQTITAANRLCMASTGGVNLANEVSWTGYLVVGDVVRTHTDTSPTGSNAALASLTVQQIVKG